LQKVALATGVLPVAAPVLRQLLTGRLEQRLIDQRRDWHADPLAWGYIVDPVGPRGRSLPPRTGRNRAGIGPIRVLPKAAVPA